ncbi:MULTISPECIES: hypothetical protein [Chryseobacterium]|uniref:Lipoprotein n=1 Tax=Chryseobacterium camelliae TaxID=1265445 RepID=A0ABU0TED5_9FLAO|nr:MULTISPECIES: hypothetical protein [Chryseobacterium]MDT3407018.1 hypothetical protein [Pseudacidovorax intermedius]MDQ1095191.1 hypothetical protein [Chryseobacterium camelliae]MDQ1099128.1 hypothetical protein [Chryseobacterium sp. SORGH_AS_1048]MDR6086477.1 hypothetical protein [Chryseobacterium sp. SORGH_AS_0909]MDR6130849.1 hypothetical protein [Chryseobacterium sp. SORGH_AS_1175]
MKKTLLALTFMALLTVNCSGNEDDTTPEQTNPVITQYFHPPTWIQGSWKISGSNSAYFKFTNDDFILVSPYTSWKAVLQQTASAGQTAKVNEDISEQYYQFTIIAGNSGGQYKFKKISDTKIQWVGSTPFFLDKE